MLNDVLNLAQRKKGDKIPRKETLNHAGLIKLASSIDPFVDTKNAFLTAYRNLGIDIINRVPEENAPSPLLCGQSVREDNGYSRSYLGLYDTYCRHSYPYSSIEELFEQQYVHLSYDSLITPVPHRLALEDIARKNALLGETGLYYYMLYTTLFMWGVEWLGWEVFLMAAATEPELFDQLFLVPAFEASKSLIALLTETESPFVFVHDDLANANGPVFHPDWYDKYIFPRYKELWNVVHGAGKQVIFAADGNMEPFFRPLIESGVDGVMLENPATNFINILDNFSDKIIIGGIETQILTFGTPSSIKQHVFEVTQMTSGVPGFAMSTPGGIHGNIPLENLIAYFMLIPN